MTQIDQVGHTDQFGLPIRIESAEALSHWNATVLAFLAHAAATPDHLGNTLSADPRFLRGHIAKGFFCALLGRLEIVQAARDSLREAKRLAAEDDADDVDRALLSALTAYLAGNPLSAADQLDALLLKRPTDAFVAKLEHAVRFVMGDARGMRASMTRIADAYGNDHPAAGYLSGCLAFSLEETGDFEAAERAGRRGLDLAADDAWGLHAVSHVLDMCARADDGVAWLEDRRESWQHCNNFRYHVWWHLALFYLDRGEYDAVFNLYDTEIRPDHTDDYRDISNAASLLCRLQLEGVEVGNRWDELAALSETRAEDNCLAFADLHYMLALLGGNRQSAATRLITGMRRQAVRGSSDFEHVQRAVGVPVAQGLAAFTAGDYAGANASLSRVMGSLPMIGGSHAQRDVFERVAIEAAIRSGSEADVRRLLDQRARRRGGVDRYARSRLAMLDTLAAPVLARSGTDG
ncbi:MAG: tetratricopeptide repeat protein [Pseudomonadota bacterium]